ncbi:MAG: glycosyltransferase family 2 protein [Bacteroidales bacterium]|nr:glycosyltransferase family 2 protein [Bacteroidales bacterium]MCF8405346.1 glycosyltransferase family 2 protein [Bacteroidales bacterium]
MAKALNSNPQPLVALGVPVYNGGDFIIECLQSILDQTYKNWECVVIDNCSKDNTNELVKDFIKDDKRFRLFKNEEFLNVMNNWNESFKHISDDAKYFKVVPADDWLFDNFLTEMISLMETDPEIGICSSYRIDGSLIRGNGLDYYKGNVFEGKKILVDELRKIIDVTGSGNTVIYRIESLKKLGFYPKIFSDLSLHVDTELAYELLAISKFGFAYNVLSYTRRHNESITTSIVSKLNTSICFRDNQLHKYANYIPDFKKYYKRHRFEYTILFIKKLLSGNKKWLDWHKAHLNNKFTFTEVVVTIIKRVFFISPSK